MAFLDLGKKTQSYFHGPWGYVPPAEREAFGEGGLRHHAVVSRDDGSPVVFRWHWPRGTFDARMSAMELAAFVLPHMPAILPLLDAHPRIQVEFGALLGRLLTTPTPDLDEVVPWIRSVTRSADDDVVELCLGGRAVESGPTHLVMGT